MNFLNAVKSSCRNWKTFSGRACRSEYWWFSLASNVLYLPVFMLDGTLHHFCKMPLTTTPFATIWTLLILIPTLSVSCRRLHDIKRTGLWLLIHYVPVFLSFLLIVVNPKLALRSFLEMMALLASYLLLVFKCIDGTNGPNRYGPDPLESEPPTVEPTP